MKSIRRDWFIVESQNVCEHAVLVLPGRGESANRLGAMYARNCSEDTMIVGITPQNLEWYPPPFGADDQEEALAGIPAALKTIHHVLNEIKKKWSIPRKKVAVVGFSAGGVMAVQAGMHLGPLAAVGCHAGAILDPTQVKSAIDETPFHLFHNEDDPVFEWEERFVPMNEALEKNGYQVHTWTDEEGGHTVYTNDVQTLLQALA